MTISYRLSDAAQADYLAIYAYSFNSFGEAQAEKYANGLLDVFTLITENRHIGRDISFLRKGYFSYQYQHHTIYYQLDKHGVLIVRIKGDKQGDFWRKKS